MRAGAPSYAEKTPAPPYSSSEPSALRRGWPLFVALFVPNLLTGRCQGLLFGFDAVYLRPPCWRSNSATSLPPPRRRGFWLRQQSILWSSPCPDQEGSSRQPTIRTARVERPSRMPQCHFPVCSHNQIQRTKQIAATVSHPVPASFRFS